MRRLRVPRSRLALVFSIRHVNHTRCFFSGNTTWFLPLQGRSFSGKCLRTIKTGEGFEQHLQTLAIETSCDDTSVAVLSVSRNDESSPLRTKVLFHEKVTANSASYGGIHPLVALDSHQKQLAYLVQKATLCLETRIEGNDRFAITRRSPDFVSVTRGPGMRANLSVGVNMAKGLALAWGVPLVGVHHMQAHALTPRLCSTIDLEYLDGRTLRGGDEDGNNMTLTRWKPEELKPRFPFLSLLVSGGHTMLIDSKALNDHRILAESQDIAVGDCLDKAARAILPQSELKAPFGKALEEFAFPTSQHYDYSPPQRRRDELERRTSGFRWSLAPPLAESKGGEKSSRRMVYSFSGLLTSIQRLMQPTLSGEVDRHINSENTTAMSIEERRKLAREVQRIAFEHLGSRILLHLESIAKMQIVQPKIDTIVVSGGVASNKFLRHVLRSTLDVRGYGYINLMFPPPELCTDNALMIAWAGMEMYDAGYESELSIKPLRKWSMDPLAEDGGILGVGGWKERRPEINTG